MLDVQKVRSLSAGTPVVPPMERVREELAWLASGASPANGCWERGARPGVRPGQMPTLTGVDSGRWRQRRRCGLHVWQHPGVSAKQVAATPTANKLACDIAHRASRLNAAHRAAVGRLGNLAQDVVRPRAGHAVPTVPGKTRCKGGTVVKIIICCAFAVGSAISTQAGTPLTCSSRRCF
jgi:hypothetical protein